MLLGVDVGGTFTDAVLLDDGAVHTAKVPTTPRRESAGVMRAVEAVLERAGAEADAVEVFAHGMTVGTNALLEERGARTALVATRGFADVLEIGRQDRPRLYRLCAPKPAPLVAPELRFEAGERIGPSGVVELLADDEPERLAAAIAASGAESVAVCLLFSYLDPSHEERIASDLRQRLPGVHVSASHEVLPRFREYERCSTTVIDAYLSPLLGRYLGRLGEAAAEAGLPQPLVMSSSGGVAPADEAARAGAWSVLSGPAGGAVGAGLLAQLSGDGDALGFDMGGTSCDVCVVEAGEVRRTDSREIDGRPIQLPMVDVHTVGAGGGSIGWRDPGGALRVGPQSAGAEPGPACYGRGGSEPTVTDANLLLGHLAGDSRLAGGVDLDPEAAERAVVELGRPAKRSRRGGALSSSTRCGPRPASSASPTRRWCGRCASSPSSAASTPAPTPCCRSAAPARCTRRRSPPSSGSGRSSVPAPAASSPPSASAPPSAAATPRGR
jgi:N-methylhydantoinase A